MSSRLIKLLLSIGVIGIVVASCTNATNHVGSRKQPVSPPSSNPYLPAGFLSSPGGPFIYDASHRVIILHGVNAVYKHPPFVVYPASGKPYNFNAQDASEIASLGFNVVRVGIIWEGAEPGTLKPNSKQVCSPTTPGKFNHIHQFNQAVLNNYVNKLIQTVDLLGKYHIYSLIDMHQDVFSQYFGGEGAPSWALCTNGLPRFHAKNRWSAAYITSKALWAAYSHFWNNNVVGNLQGNYDRVWAEIASRLKNNPWVLGYDLFNEPFSHLLLSASPASHQAFDTQLECFYTGTAYAGTIAATAASASCPPGDPPLGLIPQIRSVDPNHMIFYEPDIFTGTAFENYIGKMNFANLVLNFHNYCPARDNNGNPDNNALCGPPEAETFLHHFKERPLDATPAQPGGPAWFMSEFGATKDTVDLARMTSLADQYLIGWTYWAWKYYNDPTGSKDEALASPSGKLYPKYKVLDQTYAQAVAGIPTSMSFNQTNSDFELSYTSNPSATSPTVIFVPVSVHYKSGYCTYVEGGKVTSKPNGTYLTIANIPAAQTVTVKVTPC
ncbi:MAG: cellulase family glycosylhydrolase [Actinobacteria bacterium]|nr:cellulase family glycosylhydrolase [Actinomycetota bacterium]MCL6105476.1 cellulase family glycosylhydrolase [Actinomycetota bacterium]